MGYSYIATVVLLRQKDKNLEVRSKAVEMVLGTLFSSQI